MDRRQRWLLCKAALLSFFASFALIKFSRYIRKVFSAQKNRKNQMSAWKFSGRRESWHIKIIRDNDTCPPLGLSELEVSDRLHQLNCPKVQKSETHGEK